MECMFQILPVQLQGKLKLARIVGGSGLSGVGEERTDSRYVVDIGDVEHVGDQVHIKALAEINLLGDTYIVEDCPWSSPGVAPQVAVEPEQGDEGKACG